MSDNIDNHHIKACSLNRRVEIRVARRSDCAQILALIQQLADYQNCPQDVHISADCLAVDGFDSAVTQFKCFVADAGNEGLVGFALFYPSYSTWQGRCMFLEDLYVCPAFRGNGIGRRLISSVARYTVDQGASRLDFNVLAWNQTAKKFYDRVGACNLTEYHQWQSFRLDGVNLAALANKCEDT